MPSTERMSSAPFLLSRGLLSFENVLAGDLVILDASRRNRNFRVLCDPDMKAAYITLPGSCQLAAMDWPEPGLRLNFQE